MTLLGKENYPMGFPRKFKPRLEVKKDNVSLPDEAWITYTVCGCEKNSCGWEGWVLESARRKEGKKKKEQPIDDAWLCPACLKPLFRTGVSLRFTPSRNQTPDLIPRVDYRVSKVRYK
jgi:hypothetical protein